MHNENENLIKALTDCAIECTHCSSACLEEDDVKMMARCIALDIECADICLLTAKMITRGSDMADQMVRMCVEICRLCGAECEKHSSMEHCKACADACRKCEEACKQYA